MDPRNTILVGVEDLSGKGGAVASGLTLFHQLGGWHLNLNCWVSSGVCVCVGVCVWVCVFCPCLYIVLTIKPLCLFLFLFFFIQTVGRKNKTRVNGQLKLCSLTMYFS